MTKKTDQEQINGAERWLVLMQLSLFGKPEDRIDYVYERFEYELNRYYGRKQTARTKQQKKTSKVWERIKRLINGKKTGKRK